MSLKGEKNLSETVRKIVKETLNNGDTEKSFPVNDFIAKLNAMHKAIQEMRQISPSQPPADNLEKIFENMYKKMSGDLTEIKNTLSKITAFVSRKDK